jgi:hypothetical protein
MGHQWDEWRQVRILNGWIADGSAWLKVVPDCLPDWIGGRPGCDV